MNDMMLPENVMTIPKWHTYSSSEVPWEEGKTLRMRGDFKTNATLMEGRGMPETVRFVKWFNQNPERPNYRSHVELEVVDGNASYLNGEIFLISRTKAFLAYYIPVIF
jgi:hypothetical protein